MDRIDILGDDYKTDEWFTNDLLSEAEDDELQRIVEKAAKELSSPIALVSLILDQIQFFKAHTGLPKELENSRGTLRNASFCQFVVKDGLTFEVNDGPNDPRIPQYVVKEFNVQAYLGVPIKLGDAIVGSLCVLDKQKRKYSDSDKQNLDALSKLVNHRLEELTKKRRQTRIDLTQNALPAIISELHKAQFPSQEHLKSTFSQLANIRFFLLKLGNTLSNTSYDTGIDRDELDLAIKSSSKLQDHLGEIELDIWNSIDCLDALESMVSRSEQSSLSAILNAVQDISRNVTDQIGGFKLPKLDYDPIVYTNSRLAIALLSNCLLLFANALKEKQALNGIELEISRKIEKVGLKFSSSGLAIEDYELIHQNLSLYIEKDYPTISIEKQKNHLEIVFKLKSQIKETNN